MSILVSRFTVQAIINPGFESISPYMRKRDPEKGGKLAGTQRVYHSKKVFKELNKMSLCPGGKPHFSNYTIPAHNGQEISSIGRMDYIKIMNLSLLLIWL